MQVGGVGGADEAGRAAAAQHTQQTGATNNNDQVGLKLQLALLALEAGQSMALNPSAQKVSHLATLVGDLTHQETNLNTMQSLITFITGAASGTGIPASEKATFNTNLQHFVTAFRETYMKGQPNSTPLNQIDIDVRVKNPNFNLQEMNSKDPTTMPYLTIKVPADELSGYFAQWAGAAGANGEKMFALGGSEGVSGLQKVIIGTIQQQLDKSPMFDLPAGVPFTQANAQAFANENLQNLLNSSGTDNPLPVNTSSPDPQIAQFFDVLNAMPSGVYTPDPTGTPPMPNWNPPTDPPGMPANTQMPVASIKQLLFNPGFFHGTLGGVLGDNNQNELAASFNWLAYVNANQTESSSPTAAQKWVAALGIKSGLSSMSTSLNNGIQALNTTSTQFGQTMRTTLSTVSIIQNVLSEVTKLQSQLEGTAVRGQQTG